MFIVHKIGAKCKRTTVALDKPHLYLVNEVVEVSCRCSTDMEEALVWIGFDCYDVKGSCKEGTCIIVVSDNFTPVEVAAAMQLVVEHQPTYVVVGIESPKKNRNACEFKIGPEPR